MKEPNYQGGDALCKNPKVSSMVEEIKPFSMENRMS
jgi:hypothetical protein